MSVSRSLAVVLLLVVCGYGCGSPTSPSDESAQTFYVATTGDDQNAGTMAGPWRTLRHAVGQLHAGDTLYVRGGTYRGMENIIDSQTSTVRSGTSWSSAITIAAYPSETVTIRAPSELNAIRLTTGAPQYLIFQDLILDGINQTNNASRAGGIYLDSGANHNRFQRIEIRNSGIGFSNNNGNSPFNEVLDCKIHDNGFLGGPITDGHGLYISTSDNLIDGNEIYNNQGYGLHLYHFEGPRVVSRNIVRNNRIYDNGRHGGTAYGIVVAWGDGNLIYNNMIYGNPGGIQVHVQSSHAIVSNNAIYNNTPSEGIVIQYATGTVVKDNIVYGNGTDILDLGTETVLSNNRNCP